MVGDIFVVFMLMKYSYIRSFSIRSIDDLRPPESSTNYSACYHDSVTETEDQAHSGRYERSTLYNNLNNNKSNRQVRTPPEPIDSIKGEYSADDNVCDVQVIIDFKTFETRYGKNMNYTLQKILLLYEISNNIFSKAKFGSVNGIKIKVASLVIMTEYSDSSGVSIYADEHIIISNYQIMPVIKHSVV